MSQTARRFASNVVDKPIDRRRVLGFGPGLRMNISPRTSNLAGYAVPQGQLIIFNPRMDGYLKERMRSVKRVVNRHTGATDMAQEFDGQQEYSGLFFAEAVAAKFQGGVSDFGFRVLECLNDLDYDLNTGVDKADAYFAAVYPKLTCEMGLEVPDPVGPAGDILNKGEPWPCPTCRIAYLESTECQDRMFSSGLDYNKLEELRKTLLSSFRAGRTHAQVRYSKSKGEVDSPNGKKQYDDADYLFMQMLHKKPDHVEQAEITARAAKIQGDAIGESVLKGIQGLQDQRDFEEFKKWKAAQVVQPAVEQVVVEATDEDPPKRPRGNPNFVKKTE